MKGKARKKPAFLANKIILSELKKIGVRYFEMNMQQASAILARHHGLKLEEPIGKIAVAAALSSEFAAVLSGQKKPQKRVSGPHVHFLTDEDPSAPTQAAIDAFYSSWEWKRLSYDVKLERGRKCECCGAKAPDVRIHTDHVKPIRKYWHLRLARPNLQILCEDCNMGKGSRDETDFRPQSTSPPKRKSWAFVGVNARTYAQISGDDIGERELPEATIYAIRSARNSDF